MGSTKEKDPLVWFLSSVNARQYGSILADLLTLGVCTRCVLRFFGVYDSQVYRCAPGDSRVILRRLAFIRAKKAEGAGVRAVKKAEAQAGTCVELPAQAKDAGGDMNPAIRVETAEISSSASEGAPDCLAETNKDNGCGPCEAGSAKVEERKAKSGVEDDVENGKVMKAAASLLYVCPVCLGVLQKLGAIVNSDKITAKARTEGEARGNQTLQEHKKSLGAWRGNEGLSVAESQQIGRDGLVLGDGRRKGVEEIKTEGHEEHKSLNGGGSCKAVHCGLNRKEEEEQEERHFKTEQHRNKEMQGIEGPQAAQEVLTCDANGIWVDDIVSILSAVRNEGHIFKTFQLEVILPSAMTLRQYCLWYYLCSENYTKKFPRASELFKNPEAMLETLVSVKDAVKWTVSSQLEKAMGSQYSANAEGKICLTYSHRESFHEVERFLETCGGGGKRRKHGWEDERNGESKAEVRKICAGESSRENTNELPEEGFREEAGMSERKVSKKLNGQIKGGRDFEEDCLASVQRAIDSTSLQVFMRVCQCPPGLLAGTCELSVSCQRFPVYIGGRYLKLKRGIPQSPWSVDGDTFGKPSVQERIADIVLPGYKADGYKFNAAGREDIDVRMLGKGRPFVMEIINARQIPSPYAIASMEKAIHKGDGGSKWPPGEIAVLGLRNMTPDSYDLVREGEADKQKLYCAVVWLSRPVEVDDITKLNAMSAITVQQRTPVRVLHRRSPLIRPRRIEKMMAQMIPGQTNYLKLTLSTQAGTYVKEFVHGDMGRTQPNLGSILGCEADILKLDVMEIQMTFV